MDEDLNIEKELEKEMKAWAQLRLTPPQVMKIDAVKEDAALWALIEMLAEKELFTMEEHNDRATKIFLRMIRTAREEITPMLHKMRQDAIKIGKLH